MKLPRETRPSGRSALLGLLIALAVVVPSVSTSADISAKQIQQMYDKVAGATAILQFYFEAEDGQRVERDALVVIVDASGLAVTSIDYFPATTRFEDFKEITMLIGSGEKRQQFQAEILGRDEEAKVAFVRPKSDKPLKLDFIKFAPATLKPGDEIVVFGVVEKAVGYLRSFNVGRVNAVLEKPTKMYPMTYEARGIAGSPVFDAKGQAIGIYINYTTQRRGMVQQFAGGRPVQREGMVNVQIPVILPADRFAALIKNPPQPGEERKKAWLGVTALQPLTADLAQYYGLPKGGVIVGQVIKGSPAEKAGVRPEDIIVKFGSFELKQDEDKIVETFTQAIRVTDIGKAVETRVWRPSIKEHMTVAIVPEPSPKTAAEAERFSSRAIGFTVRELVTEDMLNLRLPDLSGVFVSFVQQSSWAAQSELRPRDIIQKVNDTSVSKLEEFQAAFAKVTKSRPKEFFFQVLRGGKDTAIIRIEPRWETAEKE